MAERPLILASQSPRRSVLLHQLGLAHRVLAKPVDETLLPGEPPEAYVERLARSKARALQQPGEAAVVLAADTAVVLDGRVLGKPGDAEDAVASLLALAGRRHEVLTGVCVLGRRETYTLSRSLVSFRPIGEAEARAYWCSGEPLDKAGGYAIQGLGALFVESLQGSYSGVMGLPLFETAQLLRQEGIDPLLRPGDAVHSRP